MNKKILLIAAAVGLSTNSHAGGEWWSADSSFTTCFKSKGPADKLDSYVGFTDRPQAKDFKDARGRLWKVEVSNSENGGRTTSIWTYYKFKDDCEREQIKATKSLADKYR